jgi:hypothetical protein
VYTCLTILNSIEDANVCPPPSQSYLALCGLAESRLGVTETGQDTLPDQQESSTDEGEQKKYEISSKALARFRLDTLDEK